MPDQIQHDVRMINISSLNNNQHVLLTYGDRVLLFAKEHLDTPKFEYKHELSITCGTYLPKRNIVVITDIMKKMWFFDVSSRELKATRNIQKRAAKIIYNKDELELLIADKAS